MSRLASLVLSVLMFTACGGQGGTGVVETDDTWTWDGAAFHLLHPATRPAAREAAAAAYDPTHGYVLMFGGQSCESGFMGNGPCTDLRDTWTWDGRAWLSHATRHRPDASLGVIVYDSGLARPIFMTYSGSGWAWDGQDWSAAWSHGAIGSPRGSPGSISLSMGYDEDRQILVVLTETLDTAVTSTGITQTMYFTTSEWDGSAWREIVSTSGITNVDDDPGGPDLQAGRMTYDRERHRLIALGGKRVWMWDGSRWTGEHPGWGGIGVTPDGTGSMLHDPTGHRLMWVGAAADSQHVHGVRVFYRWDSGGWTALPALNAPHLDFSMTAFDEARGELVLFGGQAG